MIKWRGITIKSRVTDMIVRRNTELPLDYNAMSLKIKQSIPVNGSQTSMRKKGAMKEGAKS